MGLVKSVHLIFSQALLPYKYNYIVQNMFSVNGCINLSPTRGNHATFEGNMPFSPPPFSVIISVFIRLSQNRCCDLKGKESKRSDAISLVDVVV